MGWTDRLRNENVLPRVKRKQERPTYNKKD